MVFHEADERFSSPTPPASQRKSSKRPPDVTEARARAQRAKLDTQAIAREQHLEATEASQKQLPLTSSKQAKSRTAMTLVRAIDDYLQDHEGGNHSRKTLEWHHTALHLLQTFFEEERDITLVAEVDAPD